jgi:hypothetical protein
MEVLNVYLANEKYYPDSGDGLNVDSSVKRSKLVELLGDSFVDKMMQTFQF